METTTMSSTVNKLMKKFDNELKSLLMNDLRSKRTENVIMLQTVAVNTAPGHIPSK